MNPETIDGLDIYEWREACEEQEEEIKNLKQEVKSLADYGRDALTCDCGYKAKTKTMFVKHILLLGCYDENGVYKKK